MNEKEYLDKLALLRTEKAQLFSPLFDFLEHYRPMENFDGEVEFSSEDIKITLGGMVELEINDIANAMVTLGYKTVYYDYEWYWNMQFIAKERDTKGEDD